MHACKLSSMCRAAAQSARTPGTDPARLKLTTCTCPRPTSPKLFKCTHDNDMHWGQAQERHTNKYNYSLGRDSRSKGTEKAHSDTRAQLER